MTIQFNKVTWYSKLAAVIVFVATVLLALYFRGEFEKVASLQESILILPVSMSSSTPSETIPHKANGDLTLVVGKSVTFNGLQISLDRIVQDSRCPVDVNCFWAGNTTVHVTLRSSGKVEEVDLLSDSAPHKFGLYSISVVRIDPIRHSKVTITPKDYTVVFRVVKS